MHTGLFPTVMSFANIDLFYLITFRAEALSQTNCNWTLVRGFMLGGNINCSSTFSCFKEIAMKSLEKFQLTTK